MSRKEKVFSIVFLLVFIGLAIITTTGLVNEFHEKSETYQKYTGLLYIFPLVVLLGTDFIIASIVSILVLCIIIYFEENKKEKQSKKERDKACEEVKKNNS